MEASSPSTSRSQPFQFPVSAPTTRQAAARGTRNHGSDGTTLEALHVASRRSRRTRSERAAVVSDVSEGRTRCTRTRKRQAIAEETVAGCSPNPAPRKRVRAKPANLKKPPPLVSGDDAEIKKPACAETCCICMCGVESEDLAGISGCEHRFCFGCIEKWAERENSCPLCKNRFTKIDRINKKRKKGLKNTKKVKQKDQRSDLAPGAALEGLLGRLLQDPQIRVARRSHNLTEILTAPPANFASRNQPSIARLIFSGIGNLDYSFHGPSRSFRDHTVARGSDDDSDDEESPLSSFIRAFHSHQNMPLMGVVQPVTFTARMTSSRSYASNSNDRTAGRGAENPLTIEDSDDEEEVHVYSPSS
eukprot:scaffold1996_cov127-Cylindrotheca_fusiformis.AAC.4